MANFTCTGMVRRLRRHFWRVTAVGMLVALVAASLGVAIPVKVLKNLEVPFPCMHSPCGCTDAETCWRSCCCHTHAEKLAWAREHGVVPPDYLLAETAKPACCQKRVARSGCCSRETRTCCQSDSKTTTAVMVWRKTDKRELTRIVLTDALRCQGLGSNWTLLPPTIVPPTIELEDAPPGPGECVTIVEEHFSGFLPPPDVPPPKNAA